MRVIVILCLLCRHLAIDSFCLPFYIIRYTNDLTSPDDTPDAETPSGSASHTLSNGSVLGESTESDHHQMDEDSGKLYFIQGIIAAFIYKRNLLSFIEDPPPPPSLFKLPFTFIIVKANLLSLHSEFSSLNLLRDKNKIKMGRVSGQMSETANIRGVWEA